MSCAKSQDIQELAQEIGTRHAREIIKFQFEKLDFYEKQLNDGIIDHLPQDNASTDGVVLSLVDEGFAIVDADRYDERFEALERFKDNYQPSP